MVITEDYLRAFRECLSSPIEVITNGNQWIMFMIFEMITVAFAILFYKKYGRFTGLSKLLFIITACIVGYIIHFIVMVIFIGSLYSGNKFIP